MNENLDAPVGVSVIMTTFNHENFIEQSVRSVLEQHREGLNGQLEILIGEDNSTDRTREVLAKLEREFPGQLVIPPRPANLGLSANLEDLWQRCRGKYIAVLEGDDYWTDRFKLAKVVRFLDEHPDFVGCWHAIEVVSTVKGVRPERHPRTAPPNPLAFEDLLDVNIIRNYSCVTYRRGVVNKFPEWHRGLFCGDWGLHLLHLARGPMGFIDETLGAYRMHQGGVTVNLHQYAIYRAYFELAFGLLEDLEPKFHAPIRAAARRKLKELGEAFEEIAKIQGRYHMLKLDWFASLFKPFKSLLMGPEQRSKGAM